MSEKATTTLWKTRDGVSLDALADEASPADLLAVVRRGVESGTITGDVVNWCVNHNLPALPDKPTACFDEGVPWETAIAHPHGLANCRIAERLVLPVNDDEEGPKVSQRESYSDTDGPSRPSIRFIVDGVDYVGPPPDKPKPFDIDELTEKAAAGALNDADLSGTPWSELPEKLALYALDVMVGDLVALGHSKLTMGELAQRFGILDEEGNWV